MLRLLRLGYDFVREFCFAGASEQAVWEKWAPYVHFQWLGDGSQKLVELRHIGKNRKPAQHFLSPHNTHLTERKLTIAGIDDVQHHSGEHTRKASESVDRAGLLGDIQEKAFTSEHETYSIEIHFSRRAMGLWIKALACGSAAVHLKTFSPRKASDRLSCILDHRTPPGPERLKVQLDCATEKSVC
jgi:hypothetical protein